MKYKQITIVLFLLFIFSGFDFAWGEDYDFRKTVWGMSKERVKASENSYPWTEKEDSLLYKLEFLGQKASIEYTFAGNKLFKVFVIFDDKYMWRDELANLRDFNRNYAVIRKKLIRRYGKPKKNYVSRPFDALVDNSNFKMDDNPANLEYVTIWETNTTKIRLFRNASDYICSISYCNKTSET